MKEILENLLPECKEYTKYGRVATYIPELAKAGSESFGITLIDGDGEYSAGDSGVKFTMQSVVKPMILLLALLDRGLERVRALVGVEATGKPFDTFNYSDRALTGEHINPMVNAGAIALLTLIDGESFADKFDRLLGFTRKLAKNPALDVDEAVYLSEKATGSKNRALAYMLKAYGMIDCEVEEVVDIYFRACSISVDTHDLARIARVLSLHGKDPDTHEQIVPREYARYVNATLAICGMYDGSGEFAFKVGVPAKSGVGGGIMAVVPGRMGIGIYSPALDSKGNSSAGVRALELLNCELDLSVF
ncbi:MAG: glutaminase A [Clostridia bacterium]|nr:glutaminase A [Clostridia bacterium]